MNLLEAEGKQLFRDFGIPVPEGVLTHSASEIGSISLPAVVKAQVPTGGRGKAGGIRIVSTINDARKATDDIVGMKIRGYRVDNVLIEQKIEGKRELYLSITIDRSKREPILMASAMGGMDIESVPDDRIFKDWVDPWTGVQSFQARNLSFSLGLDKGLSSQFFLLLQNLWKLFQAMDAELVEINPLVVTKDDHLVAVDSKIVIDDDALYRHEGMKKIAGDITPLEKEARDKGIAFVQLDGDIGVIANGAGLTMATLDFLTLHGGKGGVFLDLGGTDDPEKVEEALMLMAKANPKVVLINIFGGITKCDTVADGLLQAMTIGGISIPIVARIKGVNEKKAVEMLKDSPIHPVLSLEDAAKKSVEIAGGS